jgi:formylglycine-generating enzyme required for sulfatase activity
MRHSANGERAGRLRTARAFLAALAAVAALVPPAAAAGSCRSCPPLVSLPGSPALAFSRTEITFDQWRACVAAKACPGGQDDHGWGRGTRPVINVTWADANAYAAWLGRRLGRVCRLPSEAEWERAAAGGTETAFWWGDDHGTGMANCRDCAAVPPYGTTPAASFPANPFGLFDMNGNVWEWTADCWTPAADGTCPQRVIKGGSWYYYSANSTVRARSHNDARVGSYNIGIRVVCEEP